MTEPGITDLSAIELARRIASGELNSIDAVEAHIARIEAVNPKLNAVVFKRYDAARAEAREADAKRRRNEALPPLHGMPITVKECLDLAGTPSTFGLSTRASHRADVDEIHVARLRAAGAIVLGKTNVSQLLIYTEADNPVYGRTNNPWNPQRTPGGSSGGEGAIIASGGSPLGLGTDIGGSVRVPAAFCGIASLKPTSGRLTDPGRYSVPIGQRAIPSQVGVLARHVEDVALGIELANGGRQPVGEPFVALGDHRAVNISGLRVAYYSEDDSFETSPAVKRAVREAVEILRQKGARVVAWTPPAIQDALDIFGGILIGDGGKGMRRMLAGCRRTPQVAQLLIGAGIPPAILPALRGLLRALGQPSLARNLEAFGPRGTDHYWSRVESQINYQEQFAASLDQAPGGPFDVILAPACALPAFTHGATRDLLTAGAYACLYNVLGYPAGVVPVTRVQADEDSVRETSADLVVKLARRVEQGSAGLPVGVQVIARPWQEHVALAVMRDIEQAARPRPGFPLTPVTPAG